MNNIERSIKELGYAVVPIKGTSMMPLLKEGRDRVELKPYCHERLKKGDVVLYKKNDDTLVLHRIIKTENGEFFTVLGDHQFNNDEWVNKNQIIAVACGFFIKGRYVNEKTQWYRLYKKIWLSSLTVRRCFLALLSIKK